MKKKYLEVGVLSLVSGLGMIAISLYSTVGADATTVVPSDSFSVTQILMYSGIALSIVGASFFIGFNSQ